MPRPYRPDTRTAEQISLIGRCIGRAFGSSTPIYPPQLTPLPSWAQVAPCPECGAVDPKTRERAKLSRLACIPCGATWTQAEQVTR